MEQTKEDMQLDLEHFMLNGTCPNCRTGHFIGGPEGGGSINVKCDNTSCRAEYNMSLPFELSRNDRDDYRYYRGDVMIFEGLLPKGFKAWWQRRQVTAKMRKRDIRRAAITLAT